VMSWFASTILIPVVWKTNNFSLVFQVHVNLMLLEARLQAELLYGLRAITRYMTWELPSVQTLVFLALLIPAKSENFVGDFASLLRRCCPAPVFNGASACQA
jgi:hypothetical protein